MTAMTTIGATRRRRLPNRRPSETQSIGFARPDGAIVTYEATVSFDELCRPKEIFLFGAKDGSDRAADLADASVAISVALQHGVSARAMALSVSRLPDPMGEHGTMPASIIGAALDLLAQYEAEETAGAEPKGDVLEGAAP